MRDLAKLLATDPEIGFVLVADAEHAECGGWTYDPRTAVLCCACGAALYELREVGRG